MMVQGRLTQGCFIKIHQVLAQKIRSDTFVTDIILVTVAVNIETYVTFYCFSEELDLAIFRNSRFSAAHGTSLYILLLFPVNYLNI